MSVFYKFKSSKDYDTINIDGSHIPVGKLKQLILQQKKLAKTTDFDLVITNAQTKEDYLDENHLVPRNTSLLVRRVPLTRGQAKLLGLQNKHQMQNPAPVAAPIFNQQQVAASFAEISSQNPQQYTQVLDDKAANEEEKLEKFISQNTADWIPETNTQEFQRFNKNSRIPPPNYKCHRCNKSGHYIQHCPTNGDPRFDIKRPKRATGIPREFLKVVEKSAFETDEKGVMQLPGGGYAVMQPNEKAFSKVFANDGMKSVVLTDVEIPSHLKCPICGQLLKNALQTPCCHLSYCEQCIIHKLTEETNLTCPGCSTPNISIDALIPDKQARDDVEEYKRLVARQQGAMLQEGQSTPPTTTTGDEQQQQVHDQLLTSKQETEQIQGQPIPTLDNVQSTMKLSASTTSQMTNTTFNTPIPASNLSVNDNITLLTGNGALYDLDGLETEPHDSKVAPTTSRTTTTTVAVVDEVAPTTTTTTTTTSSAAVKEVPKTQETKNEEKDKSKRSSESHRDRRSRSKERRQRSNRHYRSRSRERHRSKDRRSHSKERSSRHHDEKSSSSSRHHRSSRRSHSRSPSRHHHRPSSSSSSSRHHDDKKRHREDRDYDERDRKRSRRE